LLRKSDNQVTENPAPGTAGTNETRMSIDLGFKRQSGLRLWQDRYRNYVYKPLLRKFRPRHFHAFSIGTSKSGAHSITHMLEERSMARHEAKERETIRFILRSARGEVSLEDPRAYLRYRDRHMWLEMDASNLNIELLPLLVELHPDAKFVLTIRKVLSWLDSDINHFFRHPFEPCWREIWDFRYKADHFKHPPEEKILAEKGLYTLDGYLSYWAWHNQLALDVVPPERLLIIPTHEISSSTEKLADFLHIPHLHLNTKRSHAFEGKEMFNVLDQLEPDYLQAKVQEHCGGVMERVFGTR
jgi:hypothetical protein